MWHAELIGTIFLFVIGRSQRPLIHFLTRLLPIFALLVSCPVALFAQVLQYKRPTEQLIKHYERMVAEGALLSRDGWARASKLFAQSGSYPANSEIQLMSTPGLIGETKLDGDRAQVETKWGDYYGTIDSNLRFKSVGYGGSVLMGEFFSLVFVHHTQSHKEATARSDSGEWKIESAPLARTGTIAAAIKYVERRRDQSNDPVTRKNADRTIAALRRLTPGCGNASAC